MTTTMTILEPSAEELEEAIRRAVRDTPSLRSRFNAVVRFRLLPADGDDAKGGGSKGGSKGGSNGKGPADSPRDFIVDISTTAATKGDHTAATPDLTVTTDLAVFHSLLNKKTTPQRAFMTGKLKVKGKMGLAMKLTLVLDATRRVLLDKTKERELRGGSDGGRHADLHRSKL